MKQMLALVDGLGHGRRSAGEGAAGSEPLPAAATRLGRRAPERVSGEDEERDVTWAKLMIAKRLRKYKRSYRKAKLNERVGNISWLFNPLQRSWRACSIGIITFVRFCEAVCWATEHSWRRKLIMATSKLPWLILPKLYVIERLRAPRVAPLGKVLPQKYQDPYTPEMVV